MWYSFTSNIKYSDGNINSKSKYLLSVLRIFWTIIFCMGGFFASYFILGMWKKWVESPVYTSVETTSHHVSNIPFPAVTICSVNKIQVRLHSIVLIISFYLKPINFFYCGIRLYWNFLLFFLQERRLEKSLKGLVRAYEMASKTNLRNTVS